MITGVDYILYTDKSQDALIEKIKETIPFWGNPYFVIDNEDETTDVYISRDEEMFQLMEEKGFYACLLYTSAYEASAFTEGVKPEPEEDIKKFEANYASIPQEYRWLLLNLGGCYLAEPWIFDLKELKDNYAFLSLIHI